MLWLLRSVMLKRLLLTYSLLLIFSTPVQAVVDPLEVPNNRVGVHVLDPDEIEPAAKLVNSNGGQWGYVTVVLRSNELDREKWTKFFQASRKLKIIPIVRLATYPNGGTWVKPDALDLVDFANFLADMPWPTKNRYTILFNEVNRAAEWGGTVNPLEYATLLLDAQRIFKARSSDFFLLSAGLDMSADALNFYRYISRLQPDWYDAVDGLAVHVYPNSRAGAQSYQSEVNLLRSLGYPAKPVFVTETSWPFDQLWQDSPLVAVTPFILFAGAGDFAKFSLLAPDMSPKAGYQEIYDLSKVAGSPLLAEVSPTSNIAYSSGAGYQSPRFGLWERITSMGLRFLGLERVSVGQKVFTVEVADTDTQRKQGLSNRSSLGKARGMLFVFDRPAQYTFWMQDMNFALDFIWIRGGKVVELTTNVAPPAQTGSEPRVITPAVKIDQVLEVTGATVDKYGIKVGDLVERR